MAQHGFDIDALEASTDSADTADALNAAVALKRLAARTELAAVQAALDDGWTYAQIAEALGVTRQAVHKKYASSRERRGKR